ncbi:MAG: hypothetical protein CML13_08545 [Puniceicoccaceae bacterium]|nr:hypothetical protein [Puniceicoccaceae bacterium]
MELHDIGDVRREMCDELIFDAYYGMAHTHNACLGVGIGRHVKGLSMHGMGLLPDQLSLI